MSDLELKGFKGLRNLDSLVRESQASQTTFEQIENLPIEFLTSGKYQPRKQIHESTLNELADSIKTQGIIQPLLIRKIDHNHYEIIAGERRWRAAKLAGLTHVPVIVREIADNVALAFSLIENIQRENLNSIEEAEAFARFRDEFGMTHEDIAHRVGRSRVSITNTMRLLSLAEPVKKLVEEGRVDMGHARALLTLEADQQIEVAQQIIERQLNVRETEKLVNTIKFPPECKNIERPSFESHKYEYWTSELSKKFSKNVTIKLNRKGMGKIVIQVNSPDEIDWLIEHIKVEE